MTALDVYSALRSARLILRRCEQQHVAPGSPAYQSLVIARTQVEAAEEIVGESLCPVCDEDGHAEAQCPELRDESESDSTDTVTALGMRSAFGEPR